ncbi:MAG: PCRF domain-containing protein, partial [Actinobacteria bacterium]|nr:PCRF domain-containing protein [Actinomycetota bacterium]
MTDITDPKVALVELRQRLVDARGFLDLESKEAELAELREKVSSPDLWDDPDQARAVSRRLARYDGLFDKVGGLSSKIDDAEVLLELAAEAGDEGSRQEALVELSDVSKELDDLE